ncbi:MAG: rRNA maturation RNAse YbeY, partial [Alphaproteobacteria bacterium]
MINFSVTYKCDAWDNKEDIIKQACDNVIKHFDIKMAEVSVVLADNDFVQSLNKQYRDKDKPTNV